jgi:hypothetical protein
MGMTIERGLDAAIALTRRNIEQFNNAVRRYGNIIDTYLGEAPRTLLLAHILRVNPTLYESPKYKDYRYGFMGATFQQAKNAEVSTAKISVDPAVCAYVYARELNRVSYDLYTTYSNLFTETGEDLWRCAYLRTTLEDAAFFSLWEMHPPTSADPSVYDILLYSVNNLDTALMGQSVAAVKELILKDCEFVFQMASVKGSMITSGPGREPVPPSKDAAGIFTEVRNG